MFVCKVVYLLQQFFLVEGMTVCELVVIGCYLWYGVLGCFGVVDCEKVEEVILLVGLKLLVYWLVDSFFGGEC